MRRVNVWLGASVLGLALGLLPACSGDPEVSSEQEAAQAGEALPTALLAESWVVRVADDKVRGPFESDRGWHRLVQRDYRSAAKQLGSVGGLASARAHAEAAGMYRQAALLAANSLIETYAATPKDSDPLEAAHLLSVAYAVNGDLAKAREHAARLEEGAGAAKAWHGPWKTWLAQESPSWPPDLSALPVSLPELAAGEWPGVPSLPHYGMKERVAEGEAPVVEASDPGALVALAIWHEQVARAAAGDASAAVGTYGARYRLPAEGPVAETTDLPLELLFGSDFLMPADGPFVAALTGEAGAAAVEQFAEKSALAALASRARVDGKIDAEKAVDLAAALRTWLLEEQSQGNVQGFHRTFSDIASVGLLRQLALVAEIEGNRETSGILRINAMERSTDASTACPNALLSLAAWDAANRYPLRPSDTLHNLIRRYPSLETARFGIDALALRVSRELPSGGAQN